jgi:hypothetical protein
MNGHFPDDPLRSEPHQHVGEVGIVLTLLMALNHHQVV